MTLYTLLQKHCLHIRFLAQLMQLGMLAQLMLVLCNSTLDGVIAAQVFKFCPDIRTPEAV